MKPRDNGDGFYMDAEIQDEIENVQDFVTLSRYEEAMKTIMCALRTVRVASYERQTLDDKMKAHRCMGDLEKALKILRLNYLEIESAIDDAKGAVFCDSCGDQLPHEIVGCG